MTNEQLFAEIAKILSQSAGSNQAQPAVSNKPIVVLYDYSEKAWALGETQKDFKDLLKSLGGKFNSSLSFGAGWVFSKKKTDLKVFEQYFSITKKELA